MTYRLRNNIIVKWAEPCLALNSKAYSDPDCTDLAVHWNLVDGSCTLVD